MDVLCPKGCEVLNIEYSSYYHTGPWNACVQGIFLIYNNSGDTSVSLPLYENDKCKIKLDDLIFKIINSKEFDKLKNIEKITDHEYSKIIFTIDHLIKKPELFIQKIIDYYSCNNGCIGNVSYTPQFNRDTDSRHHYNNSHYNLLAILNSSESLHKKNIKYYNSLTDFIKNRDKKITCRILQYSGNIHSGILVEVIEDIEKQKDLIDLDISDLDISEPDNILI